MRSLAFMEREDVVGTAIDETGVAWSLTTDSSVNTHGGRHSQLRKKVLTRGSSLAEREERGVVGDAGPRGSGPAALLGYGGKESWVALTCCWATREKEKDGEE